MSGVDLDDGRRIREGAAGAIEGWVRSQGGEYPAEVRRRVESTAKEGATPLVVADGARVLGVVRLRDVVKGGIRERFRELRAMGIRTGMITADNAHTAAAVAAEARVDDFLAGATPEAKLALIREYQAGGRLVAMIGDCTNDAPALAQARPRRRPGHGARRRADGSRGRRRRHYPRGAEQTIARGPAAAFLAIKQLGTNGGSFFGPNATHPCENPTFWTNGLELKRALDGLPAGDAAGPGGRIPDVRSAKESRPP